MKYIKLLCLILFAKDLQAQTDSLVRYWIYSKVTQSAEFETNNASYASTRAVYYLKDGLWKMESRYLADGNLYKTGSYADAKGTVREGDFVSYFPSGKIAGNTSYKNGKEQGLNQTWYENGKRKDSFLMDNGIIISKGYSWNDDGRILAVYDLDKEGSGIVKMLGNKNVSASEGMLNKGKKDGKWIYYADEGYKDWELIYQMDSVVSFQCFDSLGNDQKDCIFEKEARPAGGVNSWTSYLQKAIAKYDYPSKKLSKSNVTLSGEVQVKFLVNKDGSISEVNVIKSLNSEADNIVRNVILSAPNWVPGIYKNKTVRSFHTQPITFNVTNK
jgi:antitoxin component YwqK of YwqJK toxin-antitoxin module